MTQDPSTTTGAQARLVDDETLEAIRDSVRQICNRFDGPYWQDLERDGGRYPTGFIDELTESGWLSLLIPEEYGGGGAGITEAGVVLEEIHRSGANQLYAVTDVVLLLPRMVIQRPWSIRWSPDIAYRRYWHPEATPAVTPGTGSEEVVTPSRPEGPPPSEPAIVEPR